MLGQKHLLISAIIIVLVSCNTATNQTKQFLSTNLSDIITPIEPTLKQKAVNKKIRVAKVFNTSKRVKLSKTKSSEVIPQISTSLGEDFATLEREFQEFTINPDSSTILICKEGTTLK